MKKTELMSKITRTIGKTRFTLKKHSPQILIAAGVIGTVVSAVMACKATIKVNDILNETKEQLDSIHTCMEDTSLEGTYTEEDGKKDTVIVYAQTGVKLMRLYAPAVTLGVLSLGSILTSNHILRSRNIALAAAYTAVDRSFKEYRHRVVERFGDEVDRQLRYHMREVHMEETITNENGEEERITQTIHTIDSDHPAGCSDYARFFDEGNPYWENNPEYNLMFLRSQQAYANDKLRANGYLYLNDVYEMLGIPKTKAGQVVGWVYDTKHPIGDNYIDFGIFETHRLAPENSEDDYEPVIMLDFNVDGNIWDLM